MSPSSSPTPDPDWIEWATTGRPHGVRGEIRLFLHNPDSGANARVRSVRIVAPDGRTLLTDVASLRPGPRSAIARFEQIPDRDAAEAWKNSAVEVRADVFPELDDDEWYAFELEGLSAVRPDGSAYGVVDTLTDFGAGPLLAIRRGGDVEFLPFAAPYVGEVDREAGTVVVDPTDFEFD